jgi:hypothetical protein
MSMSINVATVIADAMDEFYEAHKNVQRWLILYCDTSLKDNMKLAVHAVIRMGWKPETEGT